MSSVKTETVDKRPATTTAAGSSVLIWVLSQVGVDMPLEIALAVVVLLTAIVGKFTPRETA